MGKSARLCTVTTIPSSIKCLNSTLKVLDANEITVDKDDKVVIAQLVSTCYELAVVVKKRNAKINQLSEECLKNETKLKQELMEKDRLSHRLEKRRNAIEDLKTARKADDSKLSALALLVKNTKCDVFRLQQALSHQKLRHEHEIRRKDGTLAAMKEKIYQSFSNESSRAESDQLRSTDKSNSLLSCQYDPAIDRYVRQLHDNLQVVLEENAKFRALLEDVNDKVSVEVAAFPGYLSTYLSGLSCDTVLSVVEKNFLLFLDTLGYTFVEEQQP